ncbi:MAG: cell division protein ZapA [Lachnospiraceae bacterium]|jgi:cell division protein ZapA|nr:cell division protein ZapA [Lachnospiraceae bacterium]
MDEGKKDVSAMAMKNTVEVVIAGKVFRISGYETPEYLHQVSVYINEKLAQFQQMEGYRKQNTDQKQMMLNMNLADDFFKAKRQADKLSAELEKKEREMYAVRHDLIEAQMANEKLEAEKKELKESLTAKKKELEEALEAAKRELEEKLEAQKQENAEKRESRKQEAERELRELKKTIEGQEKSLENQKKALEAQRLSAQRKLEEQNQAAQRRLSEQKRSFEGELTRLQRENRELQRRLEQRSGT